MDLQDRIKDCKVSIIVMMNGNFDAPEVALQIGFAMIHGKPMVLVVDKTVVIPDALVKVSSFVQRVDMKNEQEMYNSQVSLQNYLRTLNYGGPAGAPRIDA